jgi:DNA-binding transcriptional LysR family regulator
VTSDESRLFWNLKMQERYREHNIPIELLRTLVAITESGSFTRAASKMSLSQPAISAQMRRLHSIVGGPLFDKGGGGVTLNSRGQLVIGLVRRLLDANDRILALANSSHRERTVRVGVAGPYSREVMHVLTRRSDQKNIHIYLDHSGQIAKGLSEAYVEIGCGMFVSPPSQNPIATWEEKLVWARSPEFLLSPGRVIPLISWPDIPSDCLAIKALERVESRYEVVFASYDHEVRIAAAASGAGVLAIPERFVKPPLVVSRDYYLPPLRSIKAGVFCREGADLDDFPDLAESLASIAPANSTQRKSLSEEREAVVVPARSMRAANR